MLEIAVYDAKPYDHEYLVQASGAEGLAWRFHEFRLSAETVHALTDNDAGRSQFFIGDLIERIDCSIANACF